MAIWKANANEKFAIYSWYNRLYGLDYEYNFALSLNTSKILGVDKKSGSIEIGKDATFFISKW